MFYALYCYKDPFLVELALFGQVSSKLLVMYNAGFKWELHRPTSLMMSIARQKIWLKIIEENVIPIVRRFQRWIEVCAASTPVAL